MKKIIYFIVITICCVSCSNFLDIKPYGKKIPQSTEDFAMILNNMLYDFDNPTTSMNACNIILNPSDIIKYELFTDNFEGSLVSDYSLSVYVGKGFLVSSPNIYAEMYKVIANCNMILDNMKADTTAKQNDIKAASYALRGLAYFHLLRNFSEPCYNNQGGLGVPIMTEYNVEAKPIRATIKQTADLIISDLLKAKDLDVKNSFYRFTKDVIDAFLARVYFWIGDFEKAKEFSKLVLAKHPLLGIKEYELMMKNEKDLVGNMLVRRGLKKIFMVDFDMKKLSKGGCPLSKRFLDVFTDKDNDIRYSLIFGTKRTAIKKPISTIRSAEMQLILAESLYHLGEEEKALQELNNLREKRIKNFTPYTMQTLPNVVIDKHVVMDKDCMGKSLTPLIYAILSERRKELFMEGDRWYELKRGGRPEFWVAIHGRKYTTYKYMYTFPLPPDDIVLNNQLIQNPGYEHVQ